MRARPFLKWAGGKARLAPRIAAMVPPDTRGYHEPFVGGGAVFFAIAATGLHVAAHLSDANSALIGCYKAVRDCSRALVATLEEIERAYLSLDPAGRKARYYEVRAACPGDPVAAAARLIFLNRTGYNGLYRVNSRGGFNVPHGRYKSPRICDEQALRAASKALQSAELHAEDFESACDRAVPGDFVYLDPPYQPLSPTARFTTYTREDFGHAEQIRLRDAFERLTSRGVAAVLSNSDHPFIRGLYESTGYRIEVVQMSRAINSKSDGRAPVAELLIDNLESVAQARNGGS